MLILTPKINLQVDILTILPIFTEQNQGIYAIKLKHEVLDELEKLENNWSNPEYLRAFFKEHQDLLSTGKYEDYTINEAVIKTLKDGQVLLDQLFDYAEVGFEDPECNLSAFFTPLHESDKSKLLPYEQCKAYGVHIDNGWLRIYAIRLSVNTYIVTGGGIKLVRKMQESKYLEAELSKLKLTQELLKANGILDGDDLENITLI